MYQHVAAAAVAAAAAAVAAAAVAVAAQPLLDVVSFFREQHAVVQNRVYAPCDT